MEFTQTQINEARRALDELRAFDKYFDTAVHANYCRCPLPSELKAIHEIFTKTTGDTRRLNAGCQNCILSLVRDCGELYYKALAQAAAIAKKPRTRKTTKK